MLSGRLTCCHCMDRCVSDGEDGGWGGGGVGGGHGDTYLL